MNSIASLSIRQPYLSRPSSRFCAKDKVSHAKADFFYRWKNGISFGPFDGEELSHFIQNDLYIRRSKSRQSRASTGYTIGLEVPGMEQSISSIEVTDLSGTVDLSHGKFLVTSYKTGEVELTYRDLGSHYGTYINDKRIPANEDVTLQEGDIVRLGNAFTFTIHMPVVEPTKAWHSKALAWLLEKVRF